MKLRILIQNNPLRYNYLIVFAIAATTNKPDKLIAIIPKTIPNNRGSIIR